MSHRVREEMPLDEKNTRRFEDLTGWSAKGARYLAVCSHDGAHYRPGDYALIELPTGEVFAHYVEACFLTGGVFVTPTPSEVAE